MIQQNRLQLRFNSPAFLDDAHQSGVWRTPPIKALLREWWRIAAAPKSGYDHRSLRETEGLLFGNAWLEPDAHKNSRFCKSKVRIALGHWDEGKMRKHEPLAKIEHPEAERAGRKVEPLNYLGYGPIDRGQFKHGAALQAGETNTLDLAWPEENTDAITHTLQLVDWFGTLGGRSRNGWGSLSLGLEVLTPDHAHLAAVLCELKECLKLDWPHAIGRDNQGPLVWESAISFDNWQSAIAGDPNAHSETQSPYRQQSSHRNPVTRRYARRRCGRYCHDPLPFIPQGTGTARVLRRSGSSPATAPLHKGRSRRLFDQRTRELGLIHEEDLLG